MVLLERIAEVRDNPGLVFGTGVIPPSVDFSSHRGEIVFWPIENRVDSIVKLLAALDARVVPVLLPPNLPEGKRRRLCQRFPRFGEFDGERILGNRSSPAESSLLLALPTSASTGEPKLIAATARALTASVKAIHQAQSLEEVRSTGVVLPLHYSYAFVNQLIWGIVHRRRIDLPTTSSVPSEALDELRGLRTEMLCLTAEQARVLDRIGLPCPLHRVKVVNFAGAPFPAEQFDRVHEMFPNARIYNNYGCTEALPRLTVRRVRSGSDRIAEVGSPIPGIRLQIDTTGEIRFRGRSASPGTLRPDGTVERHPSWIGAGDLGRLRDGELEILGRKDRVINPGGERVSLLEIEQASLTLLEVDHAHATLDRSSVVLILHGSEPPSGTKLRQCMRTELPRAAWPDRVHFADRWPVNEAGKLDQRELRNRLANRELPILWNRRPVARTG